MSNGSRNVVGDAEIHAYNLALEGAAEFLEKTAADQDQMARTFAEGIDPRVLRGGVGTTHNGHVAANYTSKATLLRGQAGYIREMKLKV